VNLYSALSSKNRRCAGCTSVERTTFVPRTRLKQSALHRRPVPSGTELQTAGRDRDRDRERERERERDGERRRTVDGVTAWSSPAESTSTMSSNWVTDGRVLTVTTQLTVRPVATSTTPYRPRPRPHHHLTSAQRNHF